jgi:hypothetical protein
MLAWAHGALGRLQAGDRGATWGVAARGGGDRHAAPAAIAIDAAIHLGGGAGLLGGEPVTVLRSIEAAGLLLQCLAAARATEPLPVTVGDVVWSCGSSVVDV